MTFRLTNLLYLFALVAASLAAFGAVGLWVAGGVLAFWVLLFYLPRPGCLSLFLVGVLFLLIMALMYPAVSESRHATRRAQCMHNLRQLATAIINFESGHGCLPGTASPRPGEYPYSWRIDILHHLEQQALSNLYDKQEPWNGTRQNQDLAVTLVPYYECPSHGFHPRTDYFAIIGPQTAWGDGERRKLIDVTDGTSNTILLVEAAGRDIHWAEPKDLSFDEAVELLTTSLPPDDSDGHRWENGYFYKPNYLRNVAMCDGSVHPLAVPLSREAAAALLTAHGGEEINPEWLHHRPPPQLDYGRIWGFSLFVVLAILPGVPKVRRWVWPLTWEERQEAKALEEFEAEFRGDD